MELRTTSNFRSIVLAGTPLIDVRAPIEFEKGAFPGAVNLPLMTDEERHLVGIKYKAAGNEAATALGHELVSGPVKEARVKAWIDFAEAHPDAMLYCFRGGSRSGISQEWFQEAAGREILRLEGGYKAFRHYLLEHLEPSAIRPKPVLLGGMTGCGKTLVLKEVPSSVDLEALANHRGSSFGGHADPQPSQIDFENALAYALIRHEAAGWKHLVLEDEGRHVGRCFLPNDLAAYFKTGDLVILERPFEERVQLTLDEYVTEAQAEYAGKYGPEAGILKWHDYILESMEKTQRRLGRERCKALVGTFEDAFLEQMATGSPSSHEGWIAAFLSDYYDPMYNYQLAKMDRQVVFTGGPEEVRDYLNSLG